MISNASCPSIMRIAAAASACRTCERSARCVKARFFRMTSAAFRFCSTRTALAAPRLNASMAIAPLPENRSRKRHPGTWGLIILNNVSLIRSVVGRVSQPSIVFSGRLRAQPAITLIILTLKNKKPFILSNTY